MKNCFNVKKEFFRKKNEKNLNISINIILKSIVIKKNVNTFHLSEFNSFLYDKEI